MTFSSFYFEQNAEKLIEFLKKYSLHIKKPQVYEGDTEISITAFLMCININILIKDNNGYKSLNYYESSFPTQEVINILYKDGNHYDLLYKRNNNENEKNKEDEINNLN